MHFTFCMRFSAIFEPKILTVQYFKVDFPNVLNLSIFIFYIFEYVQDKCFQELILLAVIFFLQGFRQRDVPAFTSNESWARRTPNECWARRVGRRRPRRRRRPASSWRWSSTNSSCSELRRSPRSGSRKEKLGTSLRKDR